MCKKELFESSGMNKKTFKVQQQKLNSMQNLGTKTIIYQKKKVHICLY